MPDLQGQKLQTLADMGVVVVSDSVNHLVGTTVTKLTRTGQKAILVLHAERGSFRFKMGDHVATLTNAFPTGSITDGTGSNLLAEGDGIVLSAPEEITFVGSAANAVLTYYWA